MIEIPDSLKDSCGSKPPGAFAVANRLRMLSAIAELRIHRFAKTINGPNQCYLTAFGRSAEGTDFGVSCSNGAAEASADEAGCARDQVPIRHARRSDQRGGMRIAPSRRITSPLSMVFSIM